MDINPSPRAPKRWPLLVALGVAFTMVFVVLPNPLRIPQNNPTAAAEYAPVPGQDDSNENANFGETNAADSAGIGAGGEGEGAAPGSPEPPPPPQFKPRQKNCVGNPPKQTEDPLSPPCVPFFDGDNQGATYTGVTKDEIKIAFYNDLDVKGDMTKPWQPSDESADHQSSYQETYLVRTIKAQLRYFQARYQTYGRRVNVVAVKSQGGIGSSCSGRQGEAYGIRLDVDPFATVHLGDNGQCFLQAMARDFKVPGFGLNSDVPRKDYEDYKPYVWGFFPDQEEEAQWSASFLCRTLRNQKARFAKDLTLQTRTRTFGLIHARQDATRGPGDYQLSQLLKKYAREECGLRFDFEDEYSGGGQSQAAPIMQKYKRANVTTVICYCVPVQPELTVSTMQNAANSIGYSPEWYWDHASRMFRAIWNKRFGDPKQSSFGVNHHWRNPAFKQQIWYQSYESQEPGTKPNSRFNFDIYHLFLNLFQAIQGAGPNLTPETVERGMFTFNYQNRDNPYEPVGGYGPYGPKARSNYNFVDTAMGWWWDPAGIPPGGKAGDGCLRLMNEGKRYYAGEWPTTDGDLFVGNAPCTQDDTQIEGDTDF